MTNRTEKDSPSVGSTVRIIADEYPNLVGVTGILTEFSADGMVAWVETKPPFGVWCCVSNLSVIPPGKDN